MTQCLTQSRQRVAVVVLILTLVQVDLLAVQAVAVDITALVVLQHKVIQVVQQVMDTQAVAQ
jgi:hypothetical protein